MLEDLAVSFFGNGINSAMNQMLQEDTAQRNEEYSFRNMRFQDKLTRDLTRDTPLLTVAGLRNAGLSPNLINGVGSAQRSASASAPQETAPSVDMLSSLSAVSQINNTKAQTKLIDEQSKAQQIDNKKQEIEYEILNNRSKAYGTALRMLESDEKAVRSAGAKILSSLYNGSPDADVNGGDLPGTTVTAKKLEPLRLDSETYKVMSGFMQKELDSQESDFDANIARNKVIKSIEELKLGDKDLLTKIAHLDGKRYDQLQQVVSKLSKDNAYFDAVKSYREQVEKYGAQSAELQYKELERSIKNARGYDWHELLNKILGNGEDWSWKDMIKVLVAMTAASLSKGSTPISIAPQTTVNSVKLPE